jgi:hypothetical protein
MELFPHPLQTLTAFLCYGWGFGFLIICHVTVTLVCAAWEVSASAETLGHSCWAIQMIHHCTVVEAPNPHVMVTASTSNPNKLELFDSFHMQWMGIYTPHYAVTITTTIVGKDYITEVS